MLRMTGDWCGVTETEKEFPHVGPVGEQIWLYRGDFDRNGRSMALVSSGPAGTAAPATATTATATATAAATTTSAATANSTAASTTRCSDRALSRCFVGANPHRIDLSARSGNGGALVRKKFRAQRHGTRRRNAEGALGYEREGTNVSSAGAGDDEREAGLDQSAWGGVSGAA